MKRLALFCILLFFRLVLFSQEENQIYKIPNISVGIEGFLGSFNASLNDNLNVRQNVGTISSNDNRDESIFVNMPLYSRSKKNN